MEAFQQKTGVKGEYTRISTTRFISTVLTEFQAGKLAADVLQAPLLVMEILKDQGVIVDYTPMAAAVYPDWAKRDGVYLFGIEYVGLIYNTELVDPADVPKRYEDLTDPKWKNQIVMANPESHATTISWLIGLKENIFATEKEWWDFVKGLAANEPMFVASFDVSLEEPSRVFRGGPLKTLFRITLPVLRPAIMAAFILCIIRGLASFAVPSVLGMPGRIYVMSTYIYRYLTSSSERFVTISSRGFKPTIIELKKARVPLFAVLIVLSVLLIVLPVFVLLYTSFVPRNCNWCWIYVVLCPYASVRDNLGSFIRIHCHLSALRNPSDDECLCTDSQPS